MNRPVPHRGGAPLPALGQGTWGMGEDPARAAGEVAALRLGLDLGLGLIDTAEMYGDGGAERVVAEAIRGRRDEVYLVSKVLPHHASRRGTLEAARASLRRLDTDRLDLYLLHWTGSHPLDETYAAFEELRAAGDVLAWGVSNFDADDMARSETTPGGVRAGVNQVLYNLQRRWPEDRLLPWCRERDVAVMAYSPLEQARLPDAPELRAVADRHGRSTAAIAIAWTLREPGVVSIPKAARPEHVRDNATALDVALDAEDLALLDRAFPAPPAGAGIEIL